MIVEKGGAGSDLSPTSSATCSAWVATGGANQLSYAGYTPKEVEGFQDGNFFLTAIKGSRTYGVTGLPTGKIEVSEPVPPLKGAAA